MDDARAQQAWTQGTEALFCGRCKSAKLIIWTKTRGEDRPQQAAAIGDYWVAVHCDYFRRRIERPEELVRCAAFQRQKQKGDSST
jgi:hypothetical protein